MSIRGRHHQPPGGFFTRTCRAVARAVKSAIDTLLAGRSQPGPAAYAKAATALGLAGAVGAVQILPSVVLAILVGAFLLAGPGSLVLSWYAHLPTYAIAALLPTVSVAVCLLTITTVLMLNVYHPVWVLLGLSAATALGGLLRVLFLARRERSADTATVPMMPTVGDSTADPV